MGARGFLKQKTHHLFSPSQLLGADSRPPPKDPSLQGIIAFGERLREAGTKGKVPSCGQNTTGLKTYHKIHSSLTLFFFFLRLPQLLIFFSQLLIFNWIQLKKCGPKACPQLLLDHLGISVSLSSKATNSISPISLVSRKSSSLFPYSFYL